MITIGKEAKDLARACEAVHERLARGPLPPDDRALIEFSCINLLNKLDPD